MEIPKLTTTIANELIKRIIVYAPANVSGKRIQRIKIIFNFLWEVNPPILIDQTIIDYKLASQKLKHYFLANYRTKRYCKISNNAKRRYNR